MDHLVHADGYFSVLSLEHTKTGEKKRLLPGVVVFAAPRGKRCMVYYFFWCAELTGWDDYYRYSTNTYSTAH